MLQRLLATFAVAMALVCSTSALAATRLPNSTITAIVSCGSAGSVTIDTRGADIVSFSLSGTWTGTISYKVSADSSAFSAATAFPLLGGAGVSSATANGQWAIFTTGFAQVCIAFTASPTGSAVVTPDLVFGNTIVVGTTPLPAGTNTIGKVDQGAAAALGSAWPTKVTDGTNTMPTMDAAARPGFQKVTDGTNTMPTMDVAARAGFQKITDGTNTAAVKAASTAAVATDPSAVFALSPNSPIPTGANVIGSLSANQSVNAAQFGGTNVSTGTGAGGAGIPRVTVSNDSTVNGPTLTKGTQGGTGFSTQSLKDAGRTTINWTLDSFATTATSEALMTMVESRNGAATSNVTSVTITNGKKLRLQGFCYTAENGGSTPVVSRLKFRVRVNTAGATTTGSPRQHLATLTVTNVAKQSTPLCGQFPDGMEFNGDGTATIGFTVESPEWVTTTQIPVAHMAITAFEY